MDSNIEKISADRHSLRLPNTRPARRFGAPSLFRRPLGGVGGSGHPQGCRGARFPNTRRGIWVSALVVIFLLLAAAGWLRFQQALANWSLLASLGIWPGPLYLALGGAAWGVVGLPAAASLWLGWLGSLRLAWIAAWFYPLTFWVDRLFFSPAPEARTGWPFWLGASLLWLGYVFLVLRSQAVHTFLSGL